MDIISRTSRSPASNHERRESTKPLQGATSAPSYLLYGDPAYERILQETLSLVHQEAITCPPPTTKPPTHGDEQKSGDDLWGDAGQSLGMPLLGKLDDFLTALDGGVTAAKKALSVGKCQNLITWIDSQVFAAHERKILRQLLIDSQPRQSKWHDPGKPGQADLYDALERVLIQLKHFTPHSLPFLHRVSRKEVPDYYEVIKRPMDLGTMFKKLKSLAYLEKDQFMADLQLIYDNCYKYNSDLESPFRKHVNLLRDHWTNLMLNVPNISLNSKRDEFDKLIDAHLDKMLSDDDERGDGERDDGEGDEEDKIENENGNATLGQTERFMQGVIQDATLKTTLSNELCFHQRSGRGMAQYLQRSRSLSFPEIQSFHQSIPDNLYIPRVPLYPFQDPPIDEYIVEQCEKFCKIRDAFAPGPSSVEHAEGIEAAGRADDEDHHHLSGISTYRRLQQDLGVERIVHADCLQPRFSSRYLVSRLSWLLLQAGFQGAHSAAISCLENILSTFLLAMLKSAKSYLEGSVAVQGTFDLGHLMNKLIADSACRTSKLISFLQDTPRKNLAKLDRALQIIRERRQHYPSATHTDLDVEASSALEDRVPEEDVDMGLFGPSSLNSIFTSTQGPTPKANQQQETTKGDALELTFSTFDRKRGLSSLGDMNDPLREDEADDEDADEDYPKRLRTD